MRVPHKLATWTLFVAAMSAAAAGSNFWRIKPYTSWTAKEVQKVLWDSPWARIARTPYYPAEEYGGPPEQTKTLPPGNPRDPDPQMDPMAPPSAIKGTFHPEGAYVVRWASSETVQHALMRDAELRRSESSSTGQELPSPPASDYEIVVQSANPSPLPWLDCESVKESAYLRAGTRGVEVVAERVDVVREESPVRGRVIFYFPKATSSGTPFITPADRFVEFFAKFGPAGLRTKFNLREMAGPHGPDY